MRALQALVVIMGILLLVGTATLAAMRYAMDNDYELLLNMDADFSHPPRFLKGLLAGMATHDVMIGSRYIAGGGTENWPLKRRVLSRGVNGVVRLLMRMPVKDASGAFRCYRVSLLRTAKPTSEGLYQVMRGPPRRCRNRPRRRRPGSGNAQAHQAAR